TSSHERTSFGCAARSASRQSKFSALRCGRRHRCAVGDDAVPESFPGSHELFDQPLSLGVVLVILDDEQRGFHYTLSASISSYSWCVPNEHEDLIRQAHDECQGDIQSRDVAIVKVADLPANSGAPNRDRLVSHHVRSPTQTVSSTGFVTTSPRLIGHRTRRRLRSISAPRARGTGLAPRLVWRPVGAPS